MFGESLKRPDDAKLGLGYPDAMAGRKDEALKILGCAQGRSSAPS